MQLIEPPHQPRDRAKLASMVKSLRANKMLPAILVYGEQAYSGSHRLAAWSMMDIEPDYVEINDDEYTKIMGSVNMDPIYDSVYDYDQFLQGAKSLGLAGGAQ